MERFLTYNASMSRPFLRKAHSFRRLGFLLPSFLLMSLVFPGIALASVPLVTDPVIIDGSGKPRAILRYTVSVKNEAAIPLTVYPIVASIDPKKGEMSQDERDDADRSVQLGQWIEVSRAGTPIASGASADFPVLVQIDPDARPGSYHASIDFALGSTRAQAEKDRLGASVTINIRVEDDANERLQLASFVPEKRLFLSSVAAFRFKLDNIGNRGIVPKGQIHIYDQKGEEIEAVDLNTDGKRIDPDSSAELASTWAAAGEFGRYKALLEIDYGRGTLTDTVFFWVMPWGKLFGMFAVLATVAVIAALALHARTLALRPARVKVAGKVAQQDHSLMEGVGRTWHRVRGMMDHTTNDLEDVVPDNAHEPAEAAQAVAPPPLKDRRVSPRSLSIPPHENISAVHGTSPVTIAPREKKNIVDPRHVVHLK